MPNRASPAGFTLVEVLIVVTLLGILAALALPSVGADVHDQLQGTAQIVAGDLAYARSLAISNDGTYRFTYDLPNNRYVLQYSGTNPAFTNLPPNPFQPPGSDPTKFVVDLDDLPGLAGSAQLAAVGTIGGSPAPLTTVEFGPLGQTTATSPTQIWLTAGSGTNVRYIVLSINPVTGLASVGAFQGDGPPASIVQ